LAYTLAQHRSDLFNLLFRELRAIASAFKDAIEVIVHAASKKQVIRPKASPIIAAVQNANVVFKGQVMGDTVSHSVGHDHIAFPRSAKHPIAFFGVPST